jgi:hypothetical protein
MQAKYIHESINFERGQDPLDAMGIGMNLEIWLTSNGYTVLSDDDVKEKYPRYVSSDFYPGSYIYFIDSLNNFYIFFWWETERGTFKFARLGCNNYYQSIETVKDFSQKTFIKELTKALQRDNPRKRKISESFTRGQDPLDAMNLGKVKERKLKAISDVVGTIASRLEIPALDIEYDKQMYFAAFKYLGHRFYIGLATPELHDNSFPLIEEEYVAGYEESDDYFDSGFNTLKDAEEHLLRKIKEIEDINNNVDESIKFERGNNPLDAMDIGMTPERAWDNIAVGDKFRYDPKGTGNIPGKYIIITGLTKSTYNIDVKYKGWNTAEEMTIGKNSQTNKLGWSISYNFFLEHFRYLGHEDLKESINFERGKNPLDAMDIGSNSKYIYDNLKDGDILIYDPHGKGNIEKQYLIISNIHKINPDDIEFGHAEWKTKQDLLSRKNPKSAGRWEVPYYFFKEHFKYIGNENQFEEIKRKLSESVNFDRGQDPMKAMSVGKHSPAQIKQHIVDIITKLAKEYAYDKKITIDEDSENSEYYNVGFSYKNEHYYYIGLSPDSKTGIVVGDTNLQHPSGNEEDIASVEDAKKKIWNWIDYADEQEDEESYEEEYDQDKDL